MANIRFQELKKDSEEMIVKLTEYHDQVCKIMTAHKSRGLATVESAIRNAVAHLDRLPAAIEKSEFTSTKDVSKGASRLSKPTGKAINRSIKTVNV